jgi:hypothetical protein
MSAQWLSDYRVGHESLRNGQGEINAPQKFILKLRYLPQKYV